MPPTPLRIGSRLALSFAALLALLLVVAALALARLHELSAAFEQLSGEHLVRMQTAGDIGHSADEAARKLLVLLSAPRERRVHAYGEIDAANRKLDGLIESLAQQLPGGQAHPGVAGVRDALLAYRTAYGETVDEIEADDLALARRLMDERTEPALSRLVAAIQALTSAEQQATARVADAFDARIRGDVRIVLALCLVALAAGTALAGGVTRSIVRPLDHAVGVARRLAEGDYTQRVHVSTSDEVGRLSAGLNALAEAVGERESRIRRLANTDAMTGLAQRGRFIAEGEALLRSVHAAALVCVDVDRLKVVNAVLGFDAGDAVIREAAQRLLDRLGAQGPVGRLAGGSFAALVPLRHVDDVQALADDLQHASATKLNWNGHALDLSWSVGIALHPQHASAAETLLCHAEQALFEAKRLRSGFALYAPSIEAARRSHLSLLSELQEALAHGDLRQFLQPKLALHDGALTGAEALVRWQHPQRGWIPPGDFVPFAERTGRIGHVTQWMLDRAAATLAQWQRDGIDHSIAVNISTHDLHDGSLPQRVQRLLASRGVRPDRLQLELTESGLMDSGEAPIAQLRALRSVGVRLSIDDFGTGHSSLAYLQRLPVHELKIDRSFVSEVDLDPRRRALVVAIVALGHSLGLEVTAEGVEREEELQVLRDAGCDLVQGHLVAKPMDRERFEAWRDRQSAVMFE
jgi:diguanylate cyclase (GGDEF)-like protein